MRFVCRLTVIAALNAFLSINSWRQTATTSLKGKVADSQGGMISAASVTLSDDSKGYSRSTMTDDHGFYQFVQVPPGIYELSVKAAGFAAERTCSVTDSSRAAAERVGFSSKSISLCDGGS